MLDQINIIHEGDALTVLRQIPDAFVNCIVTSPPYWNLRDYGTATWEGGDPTCQHRVGNQVQDSKAPGAITAGVRPGADASTCKLCGAKRVDRQIGLESDPQAYIDMLVEVFREAKRVLRPDGTCFINLGDCYASSANGRSAEETKLAGGDDRTFRDKPFNSVGAFGCKPKDLMLMPFRLLLALQRDGWWVRSVAPWVKANAMPESIEDRPGTAHEYMFQLAKSERYWFDASAIRVPNTEDMQRRAAAGHTRGGTVNGRDISRNDRENLTAGKAITANGRNRRTSDTFTEMMDEQIAHWRHVRQYSGAITSDDAIEAFLVNPKGYPGAHFATFPPALIEPCVLAGCPEQVCAVCGAPYVRVIQKHEPPDNVFTKARTPNDELVHSGFRKNGVKRGTGQKYQNWLNSHPPQTLGFNPTCDCNAGVRPGVVLDMFMGAGTTGLVAAQQGRNYIGIELNPAYAEMARQRIADEGVRQHTMF